MDFLIRERLKDEKAMTISGGLYEYTKTWLTYTSNKIEGSTVSLQDTHAILTTGTVSGKGAPRVNDVIQTRNHGVAFDYIIDHMEEEITEDTMKKLHALLFEGTLEAQLDWFSVGDYKKERNIIGPCTATTDPENVGAEMKKWLRKRNQKEKMTFEDVVLFHHAWEAIHPFQDGNGRVGRLLLFQDCLREGIVPFVISPEVKKWYILGLKEAGQGAPERLLETCGKAQDDYQLVVAQFISSYVLPPRLASVFQKEHTEEK